MDLIVTILIFFGVLVLAAVLFVGWVILSIVRGVMGAILMVFRPRRGGGRAGRVVTVQSVRCPRRQCRAENPVAARFCRRCGRMLAVRDESGREELRIAGCGFRNWLNPKSEIRGPRSVAGSAVRVTPDAVRGADPTPEGYAR